MAHFFTRLIDKFLGEPEIDWDELEADLIASDIGAKRVIPLIEELQEQDSQDACDIADYIKAQLRAAFPASLPQLPAPEAGKPVVIMMVGVNGAGKTTTSAKLAHLLQKQGHKVLLAAADTFRAAAVEQLESWAARLQVPLTRDAKTRTPLRSATRLIPAPLRRALSILSAIPPGVCTPATTSWRSFPRFAALLPSRTPPLRRPATW